MILHLTASSTEPIAAGDSPYQPLALKAAKYGKYCLSSLAYKSAFGMWIAVFPVLSLSTDCTCSRELMIHFILYI